MKCYRESKRETLLPESKRTHELGRDGGSSQEALSHR